MTTDISQVVYAIGRRTTGGVVTLPGTALAVGSMQVASAYHVGGADDSNMVSILPRLASITDYQDTSDTSLKVILITLAAADPVRDLSVYSLPPNVHLDHHYKIGSSDAVPPGSPVITWGFPHANFGRETAAGV